MINVRKIKHKSHKCFGVHSVLVKRKQDEEYYGRKVGSKAIHPDAYKKYGCDYRTKAEKLNDAERNHSDD
jgi:hypothetical protein